ncbi:MAG: 4Fe-4S dicluster domain-containing protein, partial [Candidatus Edwardsbacteria bacterium]|nr:4Fe-4S dicluster domain-containing protein [Candidatus Edwardsbacteria bacterium]
YVARREAAVFVSIACNTAGPKCFCVCTDSGPFLSKGYDVQLTDLGTHYLAETGTEKGEQFVAGHRQFFGPGREDDMKKRRVLEVEAEKTFQEPVSFFAKAMRKLDRGAVKPAFWTKVANDVKLSETEGARVRSWDTCDFAGFTREVSGHNPRATRADRRKRWFYHKISMDYLEKNPVIGWRGHGHGGAVDEEGRVKTKAENENGRNQSAFTRIVMKLRVLALVSLCVLLACGAAHASIDSLWSSPVTVGAQGQLTAPGSSRVDYLYNLCRIYDPDNFAQIYSFTFTAPVCNSYTHLWYNYLNDVNSNGHPEVIVYQYLTSTYTYLTYIVDMSSGSVVKSWYGASSSYFPKFVATTPGSATLKFGLEKSTGMAGGQPSCLLVYSLGITAAVAGVRGRARPGPRASRWSRTSPILRPTMR